MVFRSNQNTEKSEIKREGHALNTGLIQFLQSSIQIVTEMGSTCLILLKWVYIDEIRTVE